jgi:hypothetical protein
VVCQLLQFLNHVQYSAGVYSVHSNLALRTSHCWLAPVCFNHCLLDRMWSPEGMYIPHIYYVCIVMRHRAHRHNVCPHTSHTHLSHIIYLRQHACKLSQDQSGRCRRSQRGHPSAPTVRSSDETTSASCLPHLATQQTYTIVIYSILPTATSLTRLDTTCSQTNNNHQPDHTNPGTQSG